MTNDENTPSFKYKVGLVTNTKADETKNGVKIAVLLKYMSNFWRSLECHWLIVKLNFHENRLKILY